MNSAATAYMGPPKYQNQRTSLTASTAQLLLIDDKLYTRMHTRWNQPIPVYYTPISGIEPQRTTTITLLHSAILGILSRLAGVSFTTSAWKFFNRFCGTSYTEIMKIDNSLDLIVLS